MAAGRPRAPTFIVPPNEILAPAQIATEHWRLASLCVAFQSDEDCLQWAARRRLIHNTMTCSGCGRPASLVAHSDSIDSKRWKCRSCNFVRSVRADSFFQRSHLQLDQIIVMVYCWACDMPQKQISREANIPCRNTVVDWCNFCRDETENHLERNPQEIGGFDANGEQIVVEIDETKFFHGKYHRGQWREGHWVFGGIERGSAKCFLVEVPDRTAHTLQQKIQQYILPGTHIISDGSAAYADIPQIAGGIYSHEVVVHERHFVSPNDDTVHTQNIQNTWMRAKRKLRRQFGTSRQLFPTYIHEFVFRNSMRHKELFSEFLVCVGTSYPV